MQQSGEQVTVYFVPLHTVAKLSLYSGVLALGVGDSMAAICGKFFGKTKWPGTVDG